MAASNSKCFEVAKAVNSVMRLHSNDQDAMLEVISDYFTSPDCCSDTESESDSDNETHNAGKHSIIINKYITNTKIVYRSKHFRLLS